MRWSDVVLAGRDDFQPDPLSFNLSFGAATLTQSLGTQDTAPSCLVLSIAILELGTWISGDSQNNWTNPLNWNGEFLFLKLDFNYDCGREKGGTGGKRTRKRKTRWEERETRDDKEGKRKA